MENFISQKVTEEISVEKFVSDFNEKNKLDGYGQEPLTTTMFLEKNNDIIRKNYTLEDIKNGFKGIKPNTDVLVPISKINIEEQMLFGSNQLYKFDTYGVYFTENQKSLQSDVLYYKSSEISTDGSSHKVKIQNLNIRVWIYSKVLKRVIDVSPFINRVDTNKTFNAGQFSIILDPFKNEEELLVQTTSQNISRIVNVFNLTDNDNKQVEDFFEKHLQFNDLVFIRFERLQVEERNTDPENEGLYVSMQKLSSESYPVTRVWDMIGLIDNVIASTNHDSSNKSITVSGRDFSKLITDDGAYFFPLKFISNEENPSMFAAGDRGSSWFKRNVITGQFDQYFFNYDFKSIQNYAFFILNHLSTIGIIDDSVFSSWGERRSKFDTVDGIKNEQEVKGVWNIIKLFVDNACRERRVIGSLGNPEGTLQEMFERICRYPLVEFFGDTWIDTYDFIIRQPPYTKKAIQEVASNENMYITIDKVDLISTRLSYDDRYYSWYQVYPMDGLMGNLQGMMTSFVPVVYFPKMAEKFGNKRFLFEDSYIRLGSTNGKNGVRDLDNMVFNLIDDLCFVIESNAYLPFTKKGIITINGDRRIKVGTFVKLESTNELFYVTGVNNSLTMMDDTLDRVTVLQVERGMKMELIINDDTVMLKDDSTDKIPKGYLINGKPKFYKYCYFDLVNTEEIRSRMKERFDRSLSGKFETNSPSDFGLNDDVFDYFLNRRYL